MTLDIETTSQKTTLKSPLKSWGGFVIGMVILLVFARMVSTDGYYNSLVNAGFLFGGLAIAWNILGGYCGQFSFGHAVFVGVGFAVGVGVTVGFAVGVGVTTGSDVGVGSGVGVSVAVGSGITSASPTRCT